MSSSSSSSRRIRMRHAIATGVVALAMFASPTAMVSANSSGLGIPCDVDNPTLGRMDRMKATIPNNASAIWPMWWTTPQQWANDLRYTLRAGDGPVGTDATSYTPGQYTEIIIRANQVDQQFTGLLMYAVNARGQRVGEWLLPPRQAFQVDPSTGCVTHSNADPKNYKSVFRVKFPAGTGQVTIKALVKFGLAFPEMKGTFYYPNSQQQGHLKLNEAQEQTQTWFQGAIGQSCSQVCESKNMVCDLLSMLQLGSSPSMLNAASKISTCFGPIMKGCGPYSPTAGTEGCWYQDSSCTRDPVNSQWVQIDPCTTDNVKPYNPNTVYEPNNNNVPCCSFQGQKWCANYYQKGQQPSENNNGWRKAGACVSASSATTQQPVQPPRAAMEMDCESRTNSKEDGQRLCACMIQVTEPPTEPPTESPPPVILPPDEQPTDQPPTDDGTTLPTDATGTTTRPATTTRPGTTTRPTTTTRPRATVAPGAGVPLGSGTNAGSRMAPHMLITLLTALLGAIMSPVSRSSRALFTIVAVIAILGDLPGSSAHNWLTSPSRSNKGGLGDYNGNTSPPCPPKGARVHAQVAAGQRFQMEWASGHGYGSSTYLAVLRASDEQQLKQVTFDVMDDYIKNAPANANVMTDSKAYHIIDGRPKRGDDTSLDRDITAQSPRPAIFRKYNSVFVYSKTAQATAGDRRVSYSSPKYPYLISVHRFAMHEDRPDDMDGVMMEIPAGYPSGQYVIQYQWRGYYDCMDINVLDVQSTDIWGRAATGGGLDQYHHTMYTPTLPNYKALDGQCIEIKEGQTIEACANLCLNNNQQCDAITVAPGTLDMNIVKFKGLFDVGGQKYATHLPPSCNNVNKANLVCYTVHSGDVPTVGPPFKTVTDPEDFTFYMTTYIKKAAWQFAQACAQCKPSVPPADFRFTDRCISCADMARNYFTQAPPKWQIATTCQHCDNRIG